jgi:monoamine oxidase
MDTQAASEVLVIGAGIAGLAAARTLAEAGLRVTLLEAQDRIGGRILTFRTAGEVIELGAEFIHGRPPGLWALLEEAGLQTYERTGDFLRLEDGALVTGSWYEHQNTPHEDPLERLKHYSGPDVSFAQYLDQSGISGPERDEAFAYVEGFNAADATQASVWALGQQQTAEDAIDGDRVWRIRDGYDRLPQFVVQRFQAAGGTLALNTRVGSIGWQPGHVRVETSAGTFTAPKAVIALPLGVLQSGHIRFEPQPGHALQAAANLCTGHVCRFTLLFARRLWPESMSFLLTRQLLPSVWWTAHPADSLTITGWIGGPRSSALLGISPTELAHRACDALAQGLSLRPEQVQAELKSIHALDWQADENTLGAYSWLPVGAAGLGEIPSQPALLARPVEDTLFFAGEHTDVTGHWGTVHAALESGLRAARQILKIE